MKKTIMASIAASTLSLTTMTHAMTSLDDQELSKVDGQALLNLEYLQGSNQTDALGVNYNQTNIGFYKLGLNAEMELNANIKRLQLGCGGSNGAGKCDLDIDNLSLSGLPADPNYTADQRTATSAKITNPFIQFAIKNPTSAASREVLGFRLSAEKISGLMTLGTENSATPNGLNSFSGYMKTKAASGIAQTAERTMTYADTNLEIKGKVKGTILGIPTTLDYTSNNYSLKLSSTAAPFTIGSTIVSGSRMTDVKLKGTGTVGQIDFAGDLTAKVLGGLLPLEKKVTGNITGLKTDITVNQSLGLIHALYLNNPASLSLQSQSILWSGAAVGANKGWWLAMEDEVELGSLSPTTQVAITNEVLKQTIAGINKDLTDNPRDCGRILGSCVFGGDLAVGNVPMNSTTLDFPLTNLTLQGQNFRPNCYGGVKFC
ncbi:hypothetical protein B9T25_01720 [Acinetobacter sp. ANC 4470]|uniref:hypothetical protein n=1 Tax=Acinetobacter sp. ANC 4470 TaxID=1977881 RepID=UPI000A33D975|nr:hypothetical protein [Acinetobacter sp. ANC 4470]OTG69328.1 hypothetical protein B9T25_01720 [Acinetobacter sp. ANC 4470]